MIDRSAMLAEHRTDWNTVCSE